MVQDMMFMLNIEQHSGINGPRQSQETQRMRFLRLTCTMQTYTQDNEHMVLMPCYWPWSTTEYWIQCCGNRFETVGLLMAVKDHGSVSVGLSESSNTQIDNGNDPWGAKLCYLQCVLSRHISVPASAGQVNRQLVGMYKHCHDPWWAHMDEWWKDYG